MVTKQDILEIKEYSGVGYKPVLDYDKWRVAYLNYSSEYAVDKINTMQKHMETDEVFVLLEGKCILLLGDGDHGVGDITAYDMEPYKIYNVKRSVWHTHTLNEEASVLIVENRNTSNQNSPIVELKEDQKEKIIELVKEIYL